MFFFLSTKPSYLTIRIRSSLYFRHNNNEVISGWNFQYATIYYPTDRITRYSLATLPTLTNMPAPTRADANYRFESNTAIKPLRSMMPTERARLTCLRTPSIDREHNLWVLWYGLSVAAENGVVLPLATCLQVLQKLV